MKSVSLSNDERAHLWRLAQARALLRAIRAVSPRDASWKTVDEIPKRVMARALKIVERGRDGMIKPTDEDVRAATQKYAEAKEKPGGN